MKSDIYFVFSYIIVLIVKYILTYSKHTTFKDQRHLASLSYYNIYTITTYIKLVPNDGLISVFSSSTTTTTPSLTFNRVNF